MLALAVDFPYFIKIITKGEKMKKKLLVLLIAVIPTLMPNLASAIAIDVGDVAGVGVTVSYITVLTDFDLGVD